jgi:GMP synthase-like glutamine amidotransferase
MSGTLWVIDPSTQVAEAEGAKELSILWPGQTRVFRPALDVLDSPLEAGYDFGGAVILGSRASVYDSFDWLNQLQEWLRPLFSGEIVRPVLGICFGHQLFAVMGGGRVGMLREDDSKLVAIRTTKLEASGLSAEPAGYSVVCSHREMVKEVPSDVFAITGCRDEVPIDAMEHRSLPIYSVQFHPEARVEFGEHCGLDLRRDLDVIQEDGRAILNQFLKKVT